ncbi:MAG: hypothetical protein M0033_07950, partial [Nitrospiraceae bacterium]|nr:hypothetical protein [Nitrospiraceae bacterium]
MGNSPLHHRALREILRAFVVAASVLLASSAVSAGMRTSLSAPGHEKITVRLKTIPARLVAGKPATLFISITGPEGKPVQGLTVMHERIMHVIITGQDFSRFAHIHPEDFERLTPGVIKKAGFRLRYAFPEGGRYAVGTSFAVRGRMVSRHFILEVSGRPEMGPPKTDLSREKRFDGYEVTLTPTGTIRAGKETSFRY